MVTKTYLKPSYLPTYVTVVTVVTVVTIMTVVTLVTVVTVVIKKKLFEEKNLKKLIFSFQKLFSSHNFFLFFKITFFVQQQNLSHQKAFTKFFFY